MGSCKRKANPNMVLIHVRITKAKCKMLDTLVKNGFYPNRSEAVRSSIDDMLRHEY